MPEDVIRSDDAIRNGAVRERRTVVRIDEQLLDEAREILGTRTITDTVNESFRQVVALAARRRAAELEEQLAGSIAEPEEERRRAWG